MPHDARNPQHETAGQETGAAIPPDLAPIAAALDRLAEADRAEPGDDFERRLAHATRPGVAGRVGGHAIAAKAPIRPWRWATPLAACLAIAAGALWATRPAAPVNGGAGVEIAAVSVETEIDDLLFIDSLGDESIETTASTDASIGVDETPAGDLFLDAFWTNGTDGVGEGGAS